MLIDLLMEALVKKFLLLVFLLPLLTGCVTYYYPQTAIEDGVYYAEDDPAYVNNAYVDYSYGYAGAAYYPWRSMDYFYLGYGPYTGYSLGYGGYIGSGFSIGLSYGYSPWDYPYYSYYSPWHYSHYAYYPYYHHGYGHKNRKNHHGRGDDRHGRGDEHYVGNDGTDRRNRGGEDEDGNEDPGDRRGRTNTGSAGVSPVRRYVSTTPSGYSGNQGMVIRNRETTKIGRSRTEPVKSAPITITSPTASTPRITLPEYRSRRGSGEIRYSAATKQGRSRTGPVDRQSGTSGLQVVSAPVPGYSRSRQGSGEIRYRSGAKQGKSRTNPVTVPSPSPRVISAPVASRQVTVPIQQSGNRQSAPVRSSAHSTGRSHSGGDSQASGRSRSSHSSSSAGSSSNSGHTGRSNRHQ